MSFSVLCSVQKEKGEMGVEKLGVEGEKEIIFLRQVSAVF